MTESVCSLLDTDIEDIVGNNQTADQVALHIESLLDNVVGAVLDTAVVVVAAVADKVLLHTDSVELLERQNCIDYTPALVHNTQDELNRLLEIRTEPDSIGDAAAACEPRTEDHN